jgi:ribosome-binding factor A
VSGQDHKRSDRVGERIRAELMALLLRGDVRDPASRDGFVTAVKLSADLRHARVYVRLTDVDAPEARRKDFVAALTRAAGFIRREISPRLELRYQPDLRFYWDDGVDDAARVEELLSEIRREDEGS